VGLAHSYAPYQKNKGSLSKNKGFLAQCGAVRRLEIVELNILYPTQIEKTICVLARKWGSIR
jgi:hypothetical protein